MLLLQEARDGEPVWWSHKARILCVRPGLVCSLTTASRKGDLDGAVWASVAEAVESPDLLQKYLERCVGVEELVGKEGVEELARAVEEGSSARIIAFIVRYEVVCQNLLLQLRLPGGGLPLHGACAGGKLRLAKFLVGVGCGINDKDTDGWTALHHAARHAHWGVAVYLLQAGAHAFAASPSGALALHYGCYSDVHPNERAGFEKFLGALRQQGVSQDARTSDGDTALHKACARACLYVARVLLRHGSAVNARNSRGATPLMDACATGSEALVQLLLSSGADPALQSHDGQDALALSRATRNPALLALLRRDEHPDPAPLSPRSDAPPDRGWGVSEGNALLPAASGTFSGLELDSTDSALEERSSTDADTTTGGGGGETGLTNIWEVSGGHVIHDEALRELFCSVPVELSGLVLPHPFWLDPAVLGGQRHEEERYEERLHAVLAAHDQLGLSLKDPLVAFAMCNVLCLEQGAVVHRAGHVFLFPTVMVFVAYPVLPFSQTRGQRAEDVLWAIATEKIQRTHLWRLRQDSSDPAHVAVAMGTVPSPLSPRFPYCQDNVTVSRIDHLLVGLRDPVDMFRTIGSLRDRQVRRLETRVLLKPSCWDVNWVHTRAPAAEAKFRTTFRSYLPSNPPEILIGHSASVAYQDRKTMVGLDGQLFWSCNFLCFSFNAKTGKAPIVIPLWRVERISSHAHGVFGAQAIVVRLGRSEHVFIERRDRMAVMRSLVEVWLSAKERSAMQEVILAGEGICSYTGLAILRRLVLAGMPVRVQDASLAFAENPDLNPYCELLGVALGPKRPPSREHGGGVGPDSGKVYVSVFASASEMESLAARLCHLCTRDGDGEVIHFTPLLAPSVGLAERHRAVLRNYARTGVRCCRIECPLVMQCMLSASLRGRDQLLFPGAAGDDRLPWIDAEDLAEVVWRYLCGHEPPDVPNSANRVVLADQPAVSFAEAAGILAAILERPVRFDSIAPRDVWQRDMSRGAGEAVRALFGTESLAVDPPTQPGAGLREWLSRAPATLADFARRERRAGLLPQRGMVRFPRQDLPRLEAFFAEVDRDGDGVIGPDEFVDVLGPLVRHSGLHEVLFNALDTTGRGELAVKDFAEGLSAMTCGYPEDALCLAQRVYVSDGEGNAVYLTDMVAVIDSAMRSLRQLHESLEGVILPMPSMVRTLERQFGGATAIGWTTLATALARCEESAPERLRSNTPASPLRPWDPDWSLAQALLLGISVSTRGLSTGPGRTCAPVLDADAFVDAVEFEVFPPSERSGRLGGTIFVTHAPRVFLNLRRAFGITEDEYRASIGLDVFLGALWLCGLDGALHGVSSSSRSGSVFFVTSDGRYVLKTIPPEEELLLKQLLSSYWFHMKQFPNSLLTRMVGLYAVRGEDGREHTFLVMENIFAASIEVHESYDLKGSTVDRQVGDALTPGQAKLAKKDLDFHHRLHLGCSRKAAFLEQVEYDCRWMERHNICDYSLLVGMHFPGGTVAAEEAKLPRSAVRAAATSEDPSRSPVYFIGIIDILTVYNYKKKGEHHLKAILHDRRQISAIPPTPYRIRFMRYVESIVE